MGGTFIGRCDRCGIHIDIDEYANPDLLLEEVFLCDDCKDDLEREAFRESLCKD